MEEGGETIRLVHSRPSCPGNPVTIDLSEWLRAARGGSLRELGCSRGPGARDLWPCLFPGRARRRR